jgi:hypothetical protein
MLQMWVLKLEQLNHLVSLELGGDLENGSPTNLQSIYTTSTHMGAAIS